MGRERKCTGRFLVVVADAIDGVLGEIMSDDCNTFRHCANHGFSRPSDALRSAAWWVSSSLHSLLSELTFLEENPHLLHFPFIRMPHLRHDNLS